MQTEIAASAMEDSSTTETGTAPTTIGGESRILMRNWMAVNGMQELETPKSAAISTMTISKLMTCAVLVEVDMKAKKATNDSSWTCFWLAQ